MSYLIDSHVLLWLSTSPDRISPQALSVIKNVQCSIYASVVSLWELTIKYRSGKLPMPITPDQYFDDLIATNGMALLPLGLSHVQHLSILNTFHNDPFDHMLICQAKAENLVLVSADRSFQHYDVPLIKA